MKEKPMKRPTERKHTLTVSVDDETWRAFRAYCYHDPTYRRPGPQLARFLKLMSGAEKPWSTNPLWIEKAIHCAFLKDGPEEEPKQDPNRIYLLASGKAVDVTSRFWRTA